MQIVESSSEVGFRIGGTPPVGVKPTFRNDLTHYFGTFPITGYRYAELSIFCSFNYLDPSDPSFITRHTRRVIGSDSRVVECVFCKPAKRTRHSSIASELQGYTIRVGGERIDSLENDLSSNAAHKIGGIPFLSHEGTAIRRMSDGLLTSGYVHLLQWSYPGPSDCDVIGEWPFHDYIFHLYVKQTEEGYDYKTMLV